MRLQTRIFFGYIILMAVIGSMAAISVRLYTATISATIILLFLSYLTIHRELKRNADEKKKREKFIGKLQESNTKNEELIRFRHNLIQNVTHELRTPLTAISGNAELLLNDDNKDRRVAPCGNNKDFGRTHGIHAEQPLELFQTRQQESDNPIQTI